MGQLNLSQFDERLSDSIKYEGYGIDEECIWKDGRRRLWLYPNYNLVDGSYAIVPWQVAFISRIGLLLFIKFSDDIPRWAD